MVIALNIFRLPSGKEISTALCENTYGCLGISCPQNVLHRTNGIVKSLKGGILEKGLQNCAFAWILINTFWYTLVCVLCVFNSMGMKWNFNHLSGHASALIEALKNTGHWDTSCPKNVLHRQREIVIISIKGSIFGIWLAKFAFSWI